MPLYIWAPARPANPASRLITRNPSDLAAQRVSFYNGVLQDELRTQQTLPRMRSEAQLRARAGSFSDMSDWTRPEKIALTAAVAAMLTAIAQFFGLLSPERYRQTAPPVSPPLAIEAPQASDPRALLGSTITPKTAVAAPAPTTPEEITGAQGHSENPVATGDGGDNGPRPPVSTQSRLQLKEAGFLFDLNGCKLEGASLDCDLLITNQGEDRVLWIQFNYGDYGISRLIDESGNEYASSGGYLGNSRGVNVGSRLVSGIPVRAGISFEHVRPEIREAKLLEISASPGVKFVVQFRNVTILRP
jgi:hypothetical protein